MEIAPPTEDEKVESWRLSTLLNVGYPLELAETLAAAHDVDLHQAVELVRNGCAPETAVAILL